MAKSSPGTSVRGGVRATIKPPFAKATVSGSGGRMGRNTAPFDTPQSMGNGSIPTKFYESMPVKTPTTLNAGQSTPILRATQAVGKRRFST